jgi:hypothetical protein
MVKRAPRTVTKRTRLSFFLDPHLLEGAERLKAQHGTPVAETIRRALTGYLTDKGVLTQPGGKKKTRP